MKNIGLGFLGVAHAHLGAYAARWRDKPELRVKPVCAWDRDAERLAGFCARENLEPAASPKALLERPDLDAVLIGSETCFHAQLVEAAAAACIPIILQKPIALTLEDAERITEAVRQSQTPFTLAWQMRVDPHNLQIRKMLASGAFGRVFMARRRHTLPTQQWKDFDKSWHVNPELNRDIFADDAAHAIDFMYWLFGMPASVTAEIGTLANPAIINDNAIAVFRYADGSFAEVSVTFAAVAGENVTEIACERGVIVQNYGDLPSCNTPWPDGGIQLKWFQTGDKAWSRSSLPDIRNHGDRISGLAAPLAAFLHGEAPPIAGAEEGRDVLRMTLACYESMEQGRRITFSDHQTNKACKSGTTN